MVHTIPNKIYGEAIISPNVGSSFPKNSSGSPTVASSNVVSTETSSPYSSCKVSVNSVSRSPLFTLWLYAVTTSGSDITTLYSKSTPTISDSSSNLLLVSDSESSATSPNRISMHSPMAVFECI